ncbi:MAG: glycogen synthase GlgA [Candidatus Sumerlaeota bacterium]
MKILLVASEIVPYAKTGGLADVAGALPKALSRFGHDVRVVMPLYRSVDREKYGLRVCLPEIWVNFPGQRIGGAVYEGVLPGTEEDNPVQAYFIECPAFFEREGLYNQEGVDYPDNALRFAYFNMAVIWLTKSLDWAPHILHCNDWQAGFLPPFLRSQVQFRYDRFFNDTRILFTIHNLAYQGLSDFSLLPFVGLSPALFNAEQMEYWGALNPLKGGLAFSDAINTVSPRYAREILGQDFGCGLDGFLRNRQHRLSGILNGIDTNEWNPRTDRFLAANYSAQDPSGKETCKRSLCESLGWEAEPERPLLAMINRLDSQKGIDLFLDALPRLIEISRARIVVLGSGNPDYHRRLHAARTQYPDALRVELTFDNKLAHRIEAGADMFLMLSRYEPCGLNQMFSLAYGTVPLVHHTGGLADTVVNADERSIAENRANGFAFYDYDAESFLDRVRYALDIYHNRPALWRQIRKTGLLGDYSWARSARDYESLYKRMTGQYSDFLP